MGYLVKYIVDLIYEYPIWNCVKVMREHSMETYLHCLSTAANMYRMAEQMDLGQRFKRDMVTGALLHDIGKLYINQELLTKTKPLTRAEVEDIKAHPELGVAAVKCLNFGNTVESCILKHHERLDGSGYPAQLIEAELGEPEKMIAVCDMYDAITSERCYKPAEKHERAMEILYQQAGGGKIETNYVDAIATAGVDLTEKEKLHKYILTREEALSL